MENTSCVLRKEVIAVLNKRLHDFKDGYRHNVAVLGDEMLGKTTLLKHFLNGISDEKLTAVYVDVVPFELSLFIKRFFNSLLYNFLKDIQLISTRETLESLVKRSKEPLPLTSMLIEHFLTKLEKEKPEILFKELFAIIETFEHEAKRSCVVILDEFHNLKLFGIKNIFQDLGKKIMFQKNTLFIFSSSQKNEAKEILANDLSLLFGNFETIELNMLDYENSQELIRSQFGEVSISKEFVNFLINFTGGHPFYLKAISDKAAYFSRGAHKETLDVETLSKTLEQMLFTEWGIFNLKFTSYIQQLTSTRNKNDFIYLLDAIATGTNKLRDLARVARKQRSEITQKLNKLTELGIISKNGSFYYIKDRLMSFWLKFVHYEKLYSLDPDYTDQALHFKNKVKSEIEGFIHTSNTKILDRMLDIFNLFERDDDIQIDRKKLRLSTFKELKIINFDNAHLKMAIFGRALDSLWLATIKEGSINEQDINEFILYTKKFKHKATNRIIVGLGGIDRNAKLLAKESNVLAWDISCLNNLFDLYGKPRIFV